MASYTLVKGIAASSIMTLCQYCTDTLFGYYSLSTGGARKIWPADAHHVTLGWIIESAETCMLCLAILRGFGSYAPSVELNEMSAGFGGVKVAHDRCITAIDIRAVSHDIFAKRMTLEAKGSDDERNCSFLFRRDSPTAIQRTECKFPLVVKSLVYQILM
jgi:hypothetical protein